MYKKKHYYFTINQIQMEKPIVRPNLLFRPLLTAGIVIMAFGTLCIWIGSSVNLQEEGEGFMIIG